MADVVNTNLLCLAETSKLDYDAVLDELRLDEEQVLNNNSNSEVRVVNEGEGEGEESLEEALNSFVEKYNYQENTTTTSTTSSNSILTPSTASVSSSAASSVETKPTAIEQVPSGASSLPSSDLSRSASSTTPPLILQFANLTFSLFSSSPFSTSLLGTTTEANEPEVLFADKPTLFKANLESLLQELQGRLSISNVDVSLEFPELQLAVSSHMIYAQKVSLAHLYELTKVLSSRSAKPIPFHAILKGKKNSFVAQYNSLVALTQNSSSEAVLAEDSLSSAEQSKDESLLSSDAQEPSDELELSEDLESLENGSSPESLSDEEVEELNDDLDPPSAVTYSRSPSPTQSPKRTFDDLEGSDGEEDHLTAKRPKV